MWKLGILKGEFKYSARGTHGGRKLYSTGRSGEHEDFGNAKIVVNVIGSAQRYPQLILKATFLLMGYEKEAGNIVHVSYGEVGVEGGSLSGRKGGWMGSEERAFTADSLLKESISKALEAAESSSRISDRGRAKDVAGAVGRSAIRFEFLRISPAKPVVFSWKTALNFDGNSGPYCMYTFARANRILEKAEYKRSKIALINFEGMERGQDFELVKLLAEAQEVVEKAASEYSPNVITDYIIELTSSFSRFYESMPVMGSGESQELRMRLLDAYMQVAKNMFGLVGIETVESM
jgi:arginyl-tRNA synthetase